jgi:hypothetical protein
MKQPSRTLPRGHPPGGLLKAGVVGQLTVISLLLLHRGMYETGRFANVDPSRVVTKQDVALLVEAMVEDLRRHPDEWENQTLERFLDALGASLASGRDWPEHLGWRLLAEALITASGYE